VEGKKTNVGQKIYLAEEVVLYFFRFRFFFFIIYKLNAWKVYEEDKVSTIKLKMFFFSI
jgi:hypothetical protein